MDLDSLPDDSMLLNLNGKLLKGNDRIDHPGGMVTSLENNNTEIWLTVNTTSGGNVKTWWTGDNGTVWDMKARNFDAHQTFDGKDQFLDGDIVVFDFALTDPAKRNAQVTTNAQYYSGNLSSVPNVYVAEVQVLGGSSSDNPFIWSGGSIFAYDSALYSTLDQVGNGGITPSGKMIKEGEGTLQIDNANEFYGGVHLGGNGTTGGLVVLNNEKGFGTYDSTSGFQQKGMVYVHENSTIDMTNPSVESINNRFVVDAGKSLTVLIDQYLTVDGNNALAAGAVNDGKGGGLFLGDQGQIIYSGTGHLDFVHNLARQGGGVYAERGYIFDVPIHVTNNYAAEEGGGIYAEKDFVLMSGSTITGNASQGSGGGIYIGNAEGAPASQNTFELHGNSVVSGNLSGSSQGGGAFVEADRTLLLSTSKDAPYTGGDIWFEDNYINIGFDPDDPVGRPHDMEHAKRNAVYLSSETSGTSSVNGASLAVTGPYNTYFYDPIAGDVGTQVTIIGIGADPTNSEASHYLPADQYGTVVFRDDSAFYGNTDVSNYATMRLESYIDNGQTVAAVYGRKGTMAPSNPQANNFLLEAEGRIAGSGTIMADTVNLNGSIDLDTGNFSRPNGRDGSGDISAADKISQGRLNNVFRGTTNVNAGVFRIAQGSSYGYAGSAGTFNLAQGATLSGGGTVTLGGGTMTVGGVISADKSTGLAVATADNIGALTVDGGYAEWRQQGCSELQQLRHWNLQAYRRRHASGRHGFGGRHQQQRRLHRHRAWRGPYRPPPYPLPSRQRNLHRRRRQYNRASWRGCAGSVVGGPDKQPLYALDRGRERRLGPCRQRTERQLA